MKCLRRMVVPLSVLGLTACTAGAGLQVLAVPDDKLRVERSAQTLLRTLPSNVIRRTFAFHIVRDDRAAAWNIAPGVIYISHAIAHDGSDDELTQLIAHSIGHDLLAHPAADTDPSDTRQAAENVVIAVVPGGLLLAGIVRGIMGSGEYTLAQEIDAERNGLRLWLHSGRTCATWIGLRRVQKARGSSWHEPIKDITPPFDDLMAIAREECVGQR
jgi:predicted Zn-dependent protease